MSERLLQPEASPPITFSHVPQLLYDKLDYLYYRYVYERPSSRYRRTLSKLISVPTFMEHTKRLIEDGIVILPAYFKGNVLEEMQNDFESWCSTKPLEANSIVHFDGAVSEFYLSRSIALSRAAVDPYLTALASYYWGKSIKLAYTRGYRTEPIPPKEYRAFQWHHDLKRKQIKVMILLTEVSPDGQRMDYIPGTHKIWHKFDSQLDTVFSKEEAHDYGTPIRCAGPPGTAIVFDTNGLHRGNRNLGPRRDQYTFNYTAGKSIFPLPGLHPEVIKELTDRQKRMIRFEENYGNFLSRIWNNFKGWYTDCVLLREW